MPKGIPLTQEDINHRRHDIFAKSVDLFIEKGFRETSMREIAEAAGMGKSTFYDYFKSKDEILVWGVEDEVLDLTKNAQEIVNQPIPAVERLRRIMEMHLKYLLARKDFYIKLTFEVQRLALESQTRIQLRRHAYQDLLRKLIDEGIREGTFRPINSLLATRTLITVLTPTVFTSRPTGTPEEMLNEGFDIILKGIQA